MKFQTLHTESKEPPHQSAREVFPVSATESKHPNQNHFQIRQ